jgi:hypothetical protein
VQAAVCAAVILFSNWEAVAVKTKEKNEKVDQAEGRQSELLWAEERLLSSQADTLHSK